MTDRLTVPWPDPEPFAARDGRPIRILAVSDEPDPSLESAVTRDRIGGVDLIVGAGDLEPNYLSFVADAFHAPLRYVRGNHDVGPAWSATGRALLPEPMEDGRVVHEAGLHLLGFSGSPVYNDRGMQVSGIGMWAKAVGSWSAAQRARPLLVVTHAPPRGLNDDTDRAHRGFTAFRWLVDRLSPPLWLHGHTALVRRGIDARCARHEGTLFYNCTGATLIELLPPATRVLKRWPEALHAPNTNQDGLGQLDPGSSRASGLTGLEARLTERARTRHSPRAGRIEVVA